LVGYLCMANLVYITTSVKGVFKISYGSLGPTEVRAIAIISNIIVYFLGNPQISLPGFSFSLYNLIIIGIIILLFFFFFYTLIVEAIQLERQDREKWLEKLNSNDSNDN
jgi:archaetidylinositol phosphate synthase